MQGMREIREGSPRVGTQNSPTVVHKVQIQGQEKTHHLMEVFNYDFAQVKKYKVVRQVDMVTSGSPKSSSDSL